MRPIPDDPWPDATLSLLVQGYEFVTRRCERAGSDVVRTRLLGEPTILLRGRDAAELVYDSSRFRRADAAPLPMVKVLFGEGGVQGLDDVAHHHRKAMLLALLDGDGVTGLASAVAQRWRGAAEGWERQGRIVLYDEVARVLTRAVHDWAGVPLAADDVDDRTADLHAMITGAGTVGAGYLRGRRARLRAEGQLGDTIEQVRARELDAADGTALDTIAHHRDRHGRLLDARVAAVELLNVLRPTVALDRYVVFCALALHRHPQWRDRLRDGEDDDVRNFVQEVRRTTPFFPFVAARTRTGFTWRGYRFEAGRRVLLDLLATNHDPSVWEDPARFDPDRFRDRDVGPFELLPQGGGDHQLGHRCAGEWVTIAVMEQATRLLVDELDYRVPEQNLAVARGRVPALPRSGFEISDVRRR